ncbi:tannase and feruloyl esterase [Roridomyces roridus]|uniref:Carboxylic ester hydrolase n=1 Tax=Roridomyces roridus TaxID=1738132 RepID=A0AAD7F8K2_9AGAR|nr:tannase and feruloyl esterase [Roridomyces roridus]
MHLLTLLLFAAPLLSYAQDFESTCLALKSTLDQSTDADLAGTTILDVSYVSSNTTLEPLGSGCPMPPPQASVPLCRVQFTTQTSPTSAVTAEAWLPEEWYGRFLTAGNGGLSGCIFYDMLQSGSALHFATISHNAGHDGFSGLPFLNNPEVLLDFSSRAVHVSTVVGKAITRELYRRPASKAYFAGCSAGGRQGAHSALYHPSDFDGILVGSPATDWNRLMHWMGMTARAVGAGPSQGYESAPEFLTRDLWDVVSQEILKQCDGLDGLEDGIIAQPDKCEFKPEVLLCSDADEACVAPATLEGELRCVESNANMTAPCLTPKQVAALNTIYSPLIDAETGELLYPRLDPGSEAIPIYFAGLPFTGVFPMLTSEWFQYAVKNVSTYDFSSYGPADGRLADEINPGGIATWSGDFSAFRDRGGKFLTYHGSGDWIIPSGNSKRMYELVASTLYAPSTSNLKEQSPFTATPEKYDQMDSFYSCGQSNNQIQRPEKTPNTIFQIFPTRN